MTDLLADLRAVQQLRGDTYSSYEVLGMVGRAADEIERLRTALRIVRSSCCIADAVHAARAALEVKP